MPKIEMFEVYEVIAQADEPMRVIVPRGVYFDELNDELFAAVKRAIHLGCTVMINRSRQETLLDNDPDLDDWPAERHIVVQERGVGGGWQPVEKKK